jgi:metalloendopeptidase OMA1, mitochondrial
MNELTHRAARTILLFGLLLLPCCLFGCGEVGTAVEGPGHRKQSLALTPEQEVELGRKAYAEVLRKSKVLPADSPESRRVTKIGERIAKAAEIEPLQREINLRIRGYRFGWEFHVLADKQVNAFCLPGGKVAVFTGLLPVAENDDQLATVMAHEVAHALAHHASERIAREQLSEEALEALNGVLGNMDPDNRRRLIGALSAGAEFGSLKYERAQESEADHIGLFLMTFAGYDPDQAVAFWERMEAAMAHTGRPPEVLSDHPSDEKRIAQLKGWAPQAKGAKRSFDQGRVAAAAAEPGGDTGRRR